MPSSPSEFLPFPSPSFPRSILLMYALHCRYNPREEMHVSSSWLWLICRYSILELEFLKKSNRTDDPVEVNLLSHNLHINFIICHHLQSSNIQEKQLIIFKSKLTTNLILVHRISIASCISLLSDHHQYLYFWKIFVSFLIFTFISSSSTLARKNKMNQKTNSLDSLSSFLGSPLTSKFVKRFSKWGGRDDDFSFENENDSIFLIFSN